MLNIYVESVKLILFYSSMSRKTKYLVDKLLKHNDSKTQDLLISVKKTALSYFIDGYSWNFSQRKACDEAMISVPAFRGYLENYDEIKIYTDLLRKSREHEKRCASAGTQVTDPEILKRLKEIENKSDLFRAKAMQNKIRMGLR